MGVKIGFVGAGHIVKSILSGMLRSKALAPREVGIYDINREILETYRDAGHPVYDSIADLVSECPAVVLAVKPQVFDAILPEVSASMTRDTLLVSVAAGITAEKIRKGVGFNCKVILCIPNTPSELGFGAAALARVEPTTEEEFTFIRGLFESCGIAEEFPPKLMNEVIPLGGSSPAFFYRMAKVMVEEAAGMGIDPDAALNLVCQTMIGSARMMLEAGSGPQELIDKVCSPGGTTLAALDAMNRFGFDEGLRQGMDVCVRRARELGAGQ